MVCSCMHATVRRWLSQLVAIAVVAEIIICRAATGRFRYSPLELVMWQRWTHEPNVIVFEGPT